MTTTDKRARQATGAEALQWRLRAGELPAYTEAREVACPHGKTCTAVRPRLSDGVHRSGYPCTGCGDPKKGHARGQGVVPCQDEDVLRVLAFCGLEEARELTYPEWWWAVDHSSLKAWERGLQPLLAKLPPHRLEGKKCSAECHEGYDHGEGNCHPTDCEYGRVDTPAQQWLMVAASLAVARECAKRWRPGVEAVNLAHQGRSQKREIARALDACEGWLAEPTPECLTPWLVAEDPGMPSWALLGGLATADAAFLPRAAGDALQAAAEILGKEAVRSIASAEIVRRIL